MAVKVTMVFQVTTSVVNPNAASAHTGGWTESLWTAGNSYVPQVDLNVLLQARRPLLPAGASIVGVRQGLYTLSQNKLLPQGTSGYKINLPGSPSFTINLPQDALEMSGTSQNSINSNRFRIGCLPDEVVQTGEYAPTSTFSRLVNDYRAVLAAGGLAWSFVGRVLSNPSARVMSITPGAGNTATIVLSGLIGVVTGTSYLRLHRVYDDINVPVKGTFQTIAGVATPPSYVISGFTGQTVSRPNGTARVDEIGIFRYAAVDVSRAVVKKIGRPSQSYRGRQSRRTRV